MRGHGGPAQLHGDVAEASLHWCSLSQAREPIARRFTHDNSLQLIALPVLARSTTGCAPLSVPDMEASRSSHMLSFQRGAEDHCCLSGRCRIVMAAACTASAHPPAFE